MRKLVWAFIALACITCGFMAAVDYVKEYTLAQARQSEQSLIRSVLVVNIFAPLGGGGFEPVGHGSGVVLRQSRNGIIILTAAHVLRDVVEHKLLISVSDDSFVLGVEAQLLSVDKVHDLALISIKSLPYPVPSARICNKPPEVFDRVVAIGAPGPLAISPTEGIIADPAVVRPDLLHDMNFPMIQHTAFISGGDSGGPLYKLEGSYWCLQGINTQSVTESPQINLAVPIQYALPILETIHG